MHVADIPFHLSIMSLHSNRCISELVLIKSENVIL